METQQPEAGTEVESARSAVQEVGSGCNRGGTGKTGKIKEIGCKFCIRFLFSPEPYHYEELIILKDPWKVQHARGRKVGRNLGDL